MSRSSSSASTGAISGSVTRRNTSQPVASSIAASSYTSGGSARRAASRMTNVSPIVNRLIRMIAARASVGSVSHCGGVRPSAVSPFSPPTRSSWLIGP